MITINEFNLNILSNFDLVSLDIIAINDYFANKNFDCNILVPIEQDYLCSILKKFTYYVCQNNFNDVDLSLSALINKFINSKIDTCRIICMMNYVPPYYNENTLTSMMITHPLRYSEFLRLRPEKITILQLFIDNRNWSETKILIDFFLNFVINNTEALIDWRDIDKSYVMLFDIICADKFKNDNNTNITCKKIFFTFTILLLKIQEKKVYNYIDTNISEAFYEVLCELINKKMYNTLSKVSFDVLKSNKFINFKKGKYLLELTKKTLMTYDEQLYNSFFNLKIVSGTDKKLLTTILKLCISEGEIVIFKILLNKYYVPGNSNLAQNEKDLVTIVKELTINSIGHNNYAAFKYLINNYYSKADKPNESLSLKEDQKPKLLYYHDVEFLLKQLTFTAKQNFTSIMINYVELKHFIVFLNTNYKFSKLIFSDTNSEFTSYDIATKKEIFKYITNNLESLDDHEINQILSKFSLYYQKTCTASHSTLRFDYSNNNNIRDFDNLFDEINTNWLPLKNNDKLTYPVFQLNELSHGFGVKKFFFNQYSEVVLHSILLCQKNEGNKLLFCPLNIGDSDNTLYIPYYRSHEITSEILDDYQNFGIFLALCVLSYPCNLVISDIIFKYLATETITTDSLPLYLRKTLEIMDNYDQGEFESAEIYMTITDTNVYGQSEIFELVENGNNIEISYDNYQNYKNKLLDFYCWNGERSIILERIYLGFHSVIKKDLIILPKILPLLVNKPSKNNRENSDAWKKYSKILFRKKHIDTDTGTVKQAYKNIEIVIKLFFDFIDLASDKEYENLVRFITGSKVLPLGGLEALSKSESYVKINYVFNSSLPTSSTCINEIVLPVECKSQKEFIKLLRLAINECNHLTFV